MYIRVQRVKNDKIKTSKLLYLADWAAAVFYFRPTYLRCVQTQPIKKLISEVIFEYGWSRPDHEGQSRSKLLSCT